MLIPAPNRVAIIAALPREIAALVRGLSADAKLLRLGIHLFQTERAFIVAGGMGSERASLAVQAALSRGQLATLISVGLAGSCRATLNAGDVAEASVVVDTRTGERFSTGAKKEWTLATTDAIASVQEKSRLAATYNAAMVDMEAATVARLAAANGLTFRAIKGISDAHDFELESLSRFSGKHGSFRTRAFALHTALRPRTWSKAAQLGRDSNRALARLQIVLKQVLAG